jgi:hypothetical protein
MPDEEHQHPETGMTRVQARRLLDRICHTYQSRAEWPGLGLVWGDEPGTATEAEQLACYQAMRAAGAIPPEVGFFMVARILERRVDRVHQAAYWKEFATRFHALREAHGLADNEDWGSGEGPPELQALDAEFEATWDQITAAVYEQAGEAELAHLFRNDGAEFDRRFEVGRHFVCGPFPRETRAPSKDTE